MSKPRFQGLVDLHAAREDEARKALGRLEVERARLVDAIDTLRADRERASTAVDHRLRGVFSAWCTRMDAEMSGLHAILRTRDVEIEQARLVLVAVHRERSVFTRLRDRATREREVARERRAVRAFDDFAAARRSDDRNVKERA